MSDEFRALELAQPVRWNDCAKFTERAGACQGRWTTHAWRQFTNHVCTDKPNHKDKWGRRTDCHCACGRESDSALR